MKKLLLILALPFLNACSNAYAGMTWRGHQSQTDGGLIVIGPEGVEVRGVGGMNVGRGAITSDGGIVVYGVKGVQVGHGSITTDGGIVSYGPNGVQVGTGFISTDAGVKVISPSTSGALASVQSTSTSGFAEYSMLDNGGTFAANLGYGNASASAPFAGVAYIQTNGKNFIFTNGSTLLSTLTAAGVQSYRAGTSTTPFYPSGTIETLGTPVGNVGAGEDNLQVHTIAANTIVVTGTGLLWDASGLVANNANAKTLKFYMGATAVLSITVPINTGANWNMSAKIVRTGSSAQRYWIRCDIIDSTLNVVTGAFAAAGTLTMTETASITLKSTGEATTNNDLTSEISQSRFFN